MEYLMEYLIKFCNLIKYSIETHRTCQVCYCSRYYRCCCYSYSQSHHPSHCDHFLKICCPKWLGDLPIQNLDLKVLVHSPNLQVE